MFTFEFDNVNLSHTSHDQIKCFAIYDKKNLEA